MTPLASVSVRPFASLGLILALAGAAAAQEWRQLPPPSARYLHAMAFDSQRGVTVLFGGSATGSRLNDTWEYDGSVWTHVSTPTRPPARQAHAMAFDSVRGVTVLFGGDDGAAFADTWEYDGQDWTQVATPAAPSARSGHMMSYDPLRGVVLFGGGAGIYLADTWEYNGTTWTQVATTAQPPARMRAGMAYDPLRQVHVLYGGFGLTGYRDDTWEYNGTWTQVPATVTPTARMTPGMAFDDALGVVVLFGGYGGQVRNDTWHFNGAWSQASPIATPPARWGVAMVSDSAQNRVVVFGGTGTAGLQNDTWEYDGVTWTLTSIATTPSSRMGGLLAYDGLRQRTVLFGGMRNTGSWQTLADTWEFDGVGWSQISTPTAPADRSWYGMSYDAARGVVVLYGGGTLSSGQWTFRNDTWEYDGTTWTQVVTNNAPSASLVYTMAYDLRRERHVVFGGIGNTPSGWVWHDETWEYDGQDWIQILTPTQPSARNLNGLTYDARRGVTVLFGGGNLLNDTWEYDGYTWTQVLTTNAPSPRVVGGAMTYDPARGRTVLFGGTGNNNGQWFVNVDTWEYDGANWQQVQVPVTPSEFGATGMAYDYARNVIVRFGGGKAVGSATTDETWEFVPPAQPAWTGYGTGCQGSAGTPVLWATSMPTLGANLDLNVSGLPSGSGLVYVANGFDIGSYAGQPLPLELSAYGLPGCRLWVAPDPAMSQGYAHTGMAAAIPIAIPNLPILAGIRFGTQVLVLDPQSPNGIGALTNAGIATIH